MMIKFLVPFLLAGAIASAAPVETLPDGVVVEHGGLFTRIGVESPSILRVATAPTLAFFDHASLMRVPRPGALASFTVQSDAASVTVRTAALQARMDLATGRVTFLDLAGNVLLAEKPGSRLLESAQVQGENTWHVGQQWEPSADEALYGLGQNQLGWLNLKGHDLELWQHNTTVAVPFLVSSRGYGLLWDNNSYTRFGDRRDPEFIPGAQLLDADGHPGGLTGSYFADTHFEKLANRRVDAKIDFAIPGSVAQPNHDINPALPAEGLCSVRWEGYLLPAVDGVYTLETFSNSGIKLWVDDKLVADHWRQNWLPWLDLAPVNLQAGQRHRIRLEWTRDDGAPTLRLRWKTPNASDATALWSEVGDGVDYYFVYGPKLTDVLAGYRRLTGPVPLMPAWAFGLWQSRQRYQTQQQSRDVVAGFRQRGIPFDNIVQDWFYWKEDAWGSHEFDPARFPDPDAWIKQIHDQHAHLMISVWGKFYPGTANFEEMHRRGFLYERNLTEHTQDWLGHEYTFYDAFNPAARQLFWNQVEQKLFHRGIDAWWMDATEPDIRPQPTLDGQRNYVHPTALGSGSRVLNASPLLNSAGVYEGQRDAAPDQRVFILTRSGFAGEQRYAAAVWSGDITSTWTALRKQIPAGLGFSLSGLPYWTMDTGGFAVPARFSTANPKPEDVEEWRELNARWFEFGTFVPLLRVHGEAPNREMWELGGEAHPAYQAELKFDRLRYRLLPYIYSVAGAVTHENSTFLRPLVLDFTGDAAGRDVTDEYLFGPALLVSPVTEYKARQRPVYLPAGVTWYDFWTGAATPGGKTVDAAAPYDAIPLFVRAGAIVPFGPELQYTGEKPADPVTLLVYAGADGDFTLYEDDGHSYAYERGECARIPLHWDEAKRTLTIGARQGSFPGMLAQRTFQVVLVDAKHPVGFSFAPQPAGTLHYAGGATGLKLP